MQNNQLSIWTKAKKELAFALLPIFQLFLVGDTWHGDRRRLISFFGLVVFVLIMFAISKHPGRVVWRHVFWGIGLQYLFGFLILRLAFGCCSKCLVPNS